MAFGNTLLIVLMAGVLIVLGIGLVMMLRGGEANKKYGNRMMVWRVGLQAGALAVLAVLFLLSDKG